MIPQPIQLASARKVHVVQGEHAVSHDPCVSFTTVLGSCVSACLHDAGAGVGGMNHFLLADDLEGEAVREDAMRYGAYAMEVLINDLMKLGARRNGLEAKLFGGAKLFDGLHDIGAINAAFARRFLRDEGVPITAASLGGRQARRIEFWPASGRVRQRAVSERADAVAPRPRIGPAEAGALELF